MAEGDGAVYNNFKEQILKGAMDVSTDTLKIALVTAHTPDIDAHSQWSDVSADEVSGTNYTAGGETLTSTAVSQDNTNDRADLTADNVTWTSLDITPTPSHAVLYDDTHVSDLLIAYWEVTTATTGGNYTLQWGANGVMLLT